MPAPKISSRTVGKTAIPPPMFIKLVSSSSVKKNTMFGRLALTTAIDRPRAQRTILDDAMFPDSTI